MRFNTGATDQSLQVFIADDAGAGVTGLVAATFPDVYYALSHAARVQITLSDLSAITSAHSDGGVFEIGGGWYRLDSPDALFTSAGNVSLSGEETDKRLIHPQIQVGPVRATDASGNALATVIDALFSAYHFVGVGEISDSTFSDPATDTQFDVTDGSMFEEGDFIRPAHQSGNRLQTELMRVNVISDDTLTVSRGQMSTPRTDLEDGMLLYIWRNIGQPATDTTTFLNKLADILLRRHMDDVEGSANGDTLDLSSLYGLIQQAQESSITNGTMTVNKTDGSTALGTKTLTTDGDAEPVTGIS